MPTVWLRRSWKSPLLTAQFAITIVFGMGAAAALVSLMLALGYQPLPYRDPGQLVAVWEHTEPVAAVMALAGPDVADFSDATHTIFSSLGAFTPASPFWLIDGGGATEINVGFIQASVFNDLGIRPVLGRAVRLDDKTYGDKATHPVWIGEHLWQTRYGGSPSVIGETVWSASDASGSYKSPLQIVGVLPAGVGIPLPFLIREPDLWILIPPNIANLPRKGALFFGVGRLRPGVSVEQAEAALTVVTKRMGQIYNFKRQNRPVVQGLDAIAHGPARQTMGLLVSSVGLVFLVACVNLAVLMGAEGRRRRREIAIRAVLGASRWRLWSDVAAEKCLLTLLSLGMGVWFASALLRVLAWLVPAAGLGQALQVPPPLNLSVLLAFATFALAASLIWSTLVVAAANGQGASRALASAGGATGYTGLSETGPGAGRWRLVLLAAQAGIGICLLAAAALTAKTYATLSAANLGPEPSRTVTMSVGMRNWVQLSDAQGDELNRQVQSRLERLPGTRAIALVSHFPPDDRPMSFVKQSDATGTLRDTIQPFSVTPSYFRTLGIPILFGRNFDNTDHRGGVPVAIISFDMAQRNWDSPEQAVGSQIAAGSKLQLHYKIVGVAANFTGFWSQRPVPMVYVPDTQYDDCCSSVILRTDSSAAAVTVLAPQLLDGMANPLDISDVTTMQARWQATLTRPLARMAGMLLLGLLGLGLSIQGVYAVAAGTVAARGHELAVRAALGAPPGRLAWNVTRALVLAVLVGALFGAAASRAMHPLMEHWLGPVAVWQAEPIAVAIVLLALAAAAGCYAPARAAARANPVEVLRQG